ncbi:hypothetical protein CQW23_28878 [Capsicum baccatum]|uniref:Leucine-rich repeat-containing N-terminal plant-type domain-containing protein n=1 Tax=Capsicum baccatum TaxID=33114 RepID=A0A2G2VHS0_CAPBA|nr:hypothetical protein CQW23_28878 [Capsicum baccatum]
MLIVDLLTSYNCWKRYPKTSSWDMRSDYCSWDGVICDEMTGHVIEFDHSSSCLYGTIDSISSLFQLSNLQWLDLSYNNFSNSYISPKFSRFSRLTHLDLSNSSSEEIPLSICTLASLVMLDLERNNLHGEIPQCLEKITALEDLHMCIFLGIFQQLSSVNLRSLNLHGNKIEGRIPQSLTNCNELQVLDLEDNHIIGTFLMLLGTLPKLQV